MESTNYRNILYITFLMIWMTGVANGQDNYTIEKIEKLEVNGFKARFNPEGDMLLLTSQHSRGLKLYDFSNGQIKEVVVEDEIGNLAVISSLEIVYKPASDQNKLQKISLLTGITTTIYNSETPEEYLAKLKNVGDSEYIMASANENLDQIVLIDKKGNKKYISPLGKKDYLNISLSPDHSKVLFRVSGLGSFITDTDGYILKELGNVEFPIWVNDDEVLFAEIKDDGSVYISSDLYLESIHISERQCLTVESDAIVLYPAISEDQRKVVFNTPGGEVFLIKIRKK